MTYHADQILSKHGIQCVNLPKGFFRYSANPNDYESLGIKNLCPLIDKHCGVFETLAEKRMATHLLQGIEVLLHYLLDHCLKKETNLDDFKILFPLLRLAEEPDMIITPLTWLGPILEVPDDQSLLEWASKPIYPEDSYEVLANLLKKTLDQDDIKSPIAKLFEPISNPRVIIEGFIKTHNIDS